MIFVPIAKKNWSRIYSSFEAPAINSITFSWLLGRGSLHLEWSKMTSAEPAVSTCPDTLHDDDGTIQERPKLLERVGLGVLSLSCSVFQSVKQLPFPFGSTVRVVEDVIGPPLQPLVTYVKNQSLNMLSYVDDQLCLIGGEVEKQVPGVSDILCKAQDLHVLSWKVANRVCRRGLVGAAADVWVEYEVVVKSKSEEALNLANKVTLLRIFVPVVQTIGVPLAQAGSNWLVRHSEVEDKHLVVCEKDASVLQMNQLDTDLDEKSMNAVEVASEGSSVKAQQQDGAVIKQVVETPQYEDPQGAVSEYPRDESPEGDVQEVYQDEIMEEETQENESSTEGPQKSQLNDDSDEADELINLFQSSWSFNPGTSLKK
ncbi:unnamed protein product [Sphagnum jensenii]|uniref:Uncharacterized protein n=1 Tax=Sphagnum jensenii TaxID=128206 RepID=A0ABP0XF42_9BRYO